MTEHVKSIIEFVREKHPEYKEKSTMFKRKAAKYIREVILYKQMFKEHEGKKTKEILNQLYPEIKPKPKSLIIYFD